MISTNTIPEVEQEVLPQAVFRESDYDRISDLAEIMPDRLFHVALLLRQELARGSVKENPPPDTVQMHSTVRFRMRDSSNWEQVKLVYPHEADVEHGLIPVTSLLGAALIGLQTGATMRWRTKDGMLQTLTVGSVV